MASQIFDAKGNVLPQCNVVNESDGIWLHTEDESAYRKYMESRETYKAYTMVASAAFTVFMVIFALNFSSNAWTTGNFVTFVLLMAMFTGLIKVARGYNEASVMVDTIHRSGTPCLEEKGNGQRVHCSPAAPKYGGWTY